MLERTAVDSPESEDSIEIVSEVALSLSHIKLFKFFSSLRVLDLVFKAFWIYIIGKWFFNWTGVTDTLNEMFDNQKATNSS